MGKSNKNAMVLGNNRECSPFNILDCASRLELMKIERTNHDEFMQSDKKYYKGKQETEKRECLKQDICYLQTNDNCLAHTSKLWYVTNGFKTRMALMEFNTSLYYLYVPESNLKNIKK